MDHSRLRRRKATNLSKPIGQQLNLYALAASAAGVGILALAEPAEAEVVYTPTHVNIAPNRTVGLDLQDCFRRAQNLWPSERIKLDLFTATANGPRLMGAISG